jgi:hypothetical protein
MKSTIIKAALLLAGMGGLLLAAQDDYQNWNRGSAPEIDAASAGTALALLGGAVLMIRGRKR